MTPVSTAPSWPASQFKVCTSRFTQLRFVVFFVAFSWPSFWTKFTLYTEQMDAEGLGHKLLLTGSGDPRRTPEKQTMGTDSISKNANPASTFALSQCKRCKGGQPGPRRRFGCAIQQSVLQNGRVHLHIIQDGPGTALEPETGTVGTVFFRNRKRNWNRRNRFPRTETGTGTVLSC